MEKTKILIVDDETELIRKPLVRQLRRAFGDYEILEASDGSEALDMVKKHHPDLVILDLMMPVMNGIDVLKELRQQNLLDTTRVVVLTAAVDDQVRLQALKMGALDYLDKTTPMDELHARIKNFLSLKTPSESEEPESDPELEPEPEPKSKAKPEPGSGPRLDSKPKTKPKPSPSSAGKFSAGSNIKASVIFVVLGIVVYYGVSFVFSPSDPYDPAAVISKLEAYYEKKPLKKNWVINSFSYLEDKSSWASEGGRLWIDVQINDKHDVTQINALSFMAQTKIAKIVCPEMSDDLNAMVNDDNRIWVRLHSPTENLISSLCPQLYSDR